MNNILTRIKNYWFPVPDDGKLNLSAGKPYLNPTPKNISSYILPVQLQRIRQDVQNWREAVSEAEQVYFPHRVKMQRLFIDTILNGHVSACIEKRRNLTLLREYRVVDAAGRTNEELTKIFRKKWFRSLLGYAIDAKLFGYSLIKFGDVVNGEISETSVVKRWNVSPDRYNVSQYMYEISGIPFLEEPYSNWCIYISTPNEVGSSDCGFGLLYKIGVYEIFCRNIMGFNGDFVEVYGQPYRVAKTMKKQGDPEHDNLVRMVSLMGSNGWAVLDETDSVELLAAANTGSGWQGYHNLEQRCEQKISKVLLGHADALDTVPGRLGNTTGADTPITIALSEIQTSDGRFIEDIVNGELIPKLQKLGIHIPQGYRFMFANDDELVELREREDKNNLATAQVVQTLVSAGYKVDAEYISERTGIPVEEVDSKLSLNLGRKYFAGVENRMGGRGKIEIKS